MSIRISLAGLAAFLLFAGCLEAESGRVLVSSSHVGPVNLLAWNEERNLLFSAGADGTVRVWNPSTNMMLQSLQIGDRPITRIAVHPFKPLLAVLEREADLGSVLSVWDWNLGSRQYVIQSREPILSLTFSPQGTYLLYSRERFESLVLLDAESGRRLPYLQNGFGMVSYAVFARNERNLMTYQPSGSLTYWEVLTGKVLKQLKTLENLTSARIASNNRFMLAAVSRKLAAIDLLTGDALAQMEIPGIIAIDVASEGSEVSVLSESASSGVLSRWYFNGRAFMRLPAEPGEGNLTALAQGRGELFTGDDEGTILGLAPGSPPRPIARDMLLPITGADLAGSLAAVASPQEILLLSSPLLEEASLNAAKLAEVEGRRIANPLSAPTSLRIMSPGKVALWNRDAVAGEIFFLDVESGEIRPSGLTFNTSLIELEPDPRGLILLEKGGRCRVLEPESLRPRFEYLSPGMNRLIFLDEGSLLGAQSSSGAFGSPLLQINLNTAETVAIPAADSVIFDLRYDSRSRRLFTLGVQREKEASFTVLKARVGEGWEQEKTLHRSPGDDPVSALAMDEEGRIYGLLGREGIAGWNGASLFFLEKAHHRPQKLFVFGSGRRLFCLNRERTLTCLDLQSRRILFNLYLFASGAWAALDEKGSLLASSGAETLLIPLD